MFIILPVSSHSDIPFANSGLVPEPPRTMAQTRTQEQTSHRPPYFRAEFSCLWHLFTEYDAAATNCFPATTFSVFQTLGAILRTVYNQTSVSSNERFWIIAKWYHRFTGNPSQQRCCPPAWNKFSESRPFSHGQPRDSLPSLLLLRFRQRRESLFCRRLLSCCHFSLLFSTRNLGQLRLSHKHGLATIFTLSQKF